MGQQPYRNTIHEISGRAKRAPKNPHTIYFGVMLRIKSCDPVTTLKSVDITSHEPKS